MSDKMTAFLSYLFQEDWTEPRILDLNITSDGFVMAFTDQEDSLFSSASDLERNWSDLLTIAGLTAEEMAEAKQLYQSRVVDWRPGSSQSSSKAEA